jgi:replication factor C subunit 1
VNKLKEWLSKWNMYHIKKTSKPVFSKENPGAKAVLISGPPGIGKTTMATIISKAVGYDVLEMNASDTRNKNNIIEKVSDVCLSHAISMNGHTSRRVVIMDEVDGMGGSDRGGIQELIKVIKSSRSPIICICNDRQSPKIRSLANHCYDLRVRRPTKTQIASRAVQIAAKEGLQVDNNAAEMLVEQSGNDIRQVLHAMQMWGAHASIMRYMDLKDGLKRIEKDKVLRQSPFDACQMILSGSRSDLNLNDRYNSFFIDYSLLPLLIQQNYIDASKGGIFKKPNLSDEAKMDLLSVAADAVSDMDLAGSSIRDDDLHWELLPAQAAMSLRVGTTIEGFQGFPSFPAWLGKYSTTTKSKRLTKELVLHTALSIGQGFIGIRLDYASYMRDALLKPLLSNESDAVTKVCNLLEVLSSYCIL